MDTEQFWRTIQQNVKNKDGQPAVESEAGTGYLDGVPQSWVENGPVYWEDSHGRKAVSMIVNDGVREGVITFHERYSDRLDPVVAASHEVYALRVDQVGLNEILNLVWGREVEYNDKHTFKRVTSTPETEIEETGTVRFTIEPIRKDDAFDFLAGSSDASLNDKGQIIVEHTMKGVPGNDFIDILIYAHEMVNAHSANVGPNGGYDVGPMWGQMVSFYVDGEKVYDRSEQGALVDHLRYKKGLAS